MSVGEALLHGLEYTAIGMGTVFAVLIFISFCIMLMGKLIGPKKPSADDAADAKDLASIEAVVETPAAEDTGVSPEIVAAIMGAIQMKLDAEVGEGGYRLRNIRRAEWRHM